MFNIMDGWGCEMLKNYGFNIIWAWGFALLKGGKNLFDEYISYPW
jgi:hypothetical protein